MDPAALAIAVLPVIVGGEGLVAPAITDTIVADVVARAVHERPSLRLVKNEELFGSEQLHAHVSCGADAKCIVDHLRAAEIDLAILVVVDLDSAPLVVSVELFDTRDEKKHARILGELAAGEPDAQTAIAKRSAALLDRAGYAVPAPIVSPAPAAAVDVGVGGDEVLSSPWTWAIVLGALAIGGGAIALIASGSDRACLCFARPGVSCDPCP